MNRLAALVKERLPAPANYREMQTALKVSAWLLILFHGDPDLVGALVGMIGRIAG